MEPTTLSYLLPSSWRAPMVRMETAHHLLFLARNCAARNGQPRTLHFLPNGKARAKNAPSTVFLAGPPVTAAFPPCGRVGTWFQLWPGPVKVGGGASVQAILPEADSRGVVLHPSGWIEGISMPRGWPLVPDIAIRVDYGQPEVAAYSHQIIRVGLPVNGREARRSRTSVLSS